MSAIPGRGRRIATVLAEHASRVLTRARLAPSPWADAMRRELDYIEDDRAALRWAIGCITTSYAAQFVVVLRFCGRILSRPLLAAGMLLSVALALAHANDLVKGPGCGARPSAEPIADFRPAPNPSCSDRGQPARFIAKDGLPP
jgi:hypothetical protein